MNHLLEMSGISKRFPGVVALDSVALEVSRGEIVALVGENGAGKSTLMKILAGIEHPDAGSIRIDGNAVSIASPREAARLGIAIIHQELELIDTLDIASNVFLGREPLWGGPCRFIDSRKIYVECEEYLSRLGLKLSPRTLVERLSTAERQLVEIAKAVSLKAKILIMDEPTSSLTLSEAERLFEVVRELRAEGVGIIYISHRLSEIETLADRVVVLRDGRNAGALAREEIRHDAMVRMMVGRNLESSYSDHAPSSGPVCLEVRELRTQRYPAHPVTLSFHRGEIFGLAGLVGAGRSELVRSIFGVDNAVSGSLRLDGSSIRVQSPRDAISHGIYLLPEDRRACGLLTEWTVCHNITLPGLSGYASAGLIRRAAERKTAERLCADLRIKTPSVETTAANLSGGNQQKVVVAKWVSLEPKAILFDEPTRGVDVGAKAEIYQLMRRLAREGAAVVMVSSDMEEILGVTDRVAVMREGRVTGILDRSKYTQEAIMQLAVAG